MRNEFKSHIFIRDRREKGEVTRVTILDDDTDPHASCPTAVKMNAKMKGMRGEARKAVWCGLVDSHLRGHKKN